MTQKYTRSRQIAQNSVLLYARMLIVMIITLFTVRIVLDALGVKDYGIYNVVAGIVTTLSFFSGVMSSATQRFYSFYLGRNDTKHLNNIFNASANIYLLLSAAVLIIGETIGLWFVNSQLTIPEERMLAANWIYQFSIFSFISTILSIPYLSALIAHEHLNIYSIISIAECLLKLVFAYILYVVPADRLVFYGGLLFVVCVIKTVAYVLICFNKYEECRYKRIRDNNIYKEILSFSAWSLFGSIARVGNVQGNTILVNIFFGPIVNASRAIALQVNTALDVFSNSFIMAVRPPMVKSYAEGNYKYMMQLFNFSNKFIYYCLLIVCLPFMFEMDIVLGLWLKQVTDDMILFTRLTLVFSIISSLHSPITIIIQATGNVKRYFMSIELFTLLSMPLTFLFFKLGFDPASTFIVMICVFFAAHFMRLIILQGAIPQFRMFDYFSFFCLPALLITITSTVCIYFVKQLVSGQLLQLLFVGFSSLVIISIQVVLFGMSKDEKAIIKTLIYNRKNK